MKLVIEIPEEEYRWILQSDKTVFADVASKECMLHAIKSGTPLPKGHGRLIDADKLEYTCNSDECGMLMGCNHCQYHVITEDEIDNAPTIIEADKAESEVEEC